MFLKKNIFQHWESYINLSNIWLVLLLILLHFFFFFFFFDSLFNLFSTSTCFGLFEIIFFFEFFSLSSKSIYFTKLAISFLLAKFVCANLAAKLSDVNWLNSWVVIHLSWSWSVVILFSISLLFCVIVSFFWSNY